MSDKPPFEWANYSNLLSTDYNRLLSVLRGGTAVAALIDDEGLDRVVQGVFYSGSVDFRTQGVSYLYLFEDQLDHFGALCEKKKVRWFVPCDNTPPVWDDSKDALRQAWNELQQSVIIARSESAMLRAELAQLRAENEWMGGRLNAIADTVRPVSLPEEVNGFEDIPKVITRLTARVAELEASFLWLCDHSANLTRLANLAAPRLLNCPEFCVEYDATFPHTPEYWAGMDAAQTIYRGLSAPGKSGHDRP